MPSFDTSDPVQTYKPPVRCVNVSDRVAQFEIPSAPGTPAQQFLVQPNQVVSIPHGYAIEFMSTANKLMPPTIESITGIEVWPGKRGKDKTGQIVWITMPGRVLPQVVPVTRADMWRGKWQEELAARDARTAQPMRLTLQRDDGTEVEVEAEVKPVPKPKPMPGAFASGSPPADGEDDDMDEVVLPSADAAQATPATGGNAPPTRAEAKERAKK